MHTDLYEGVAEVRHVAIGQAADLIVIAPATANTIAKLATGLADDLLGNTVLASEAPVVIAPAMHTEMWRQPGHPGATSPRCAPAASRSSVPRVGQLTGADSGPGRMEEPDVDRRGAPSSAPRHPARRDLAGRRIVVTAGGTREPLDPVRFLGNRSSGKQGVAIAEAARARGAEVTLIAANLEIAEPGRLRHPPRRRPPSSCRQAVHGCRARRRRRRHGRRRRRLPAGRRQRVEDQEGRERRRA